MIQALYRQGQAQAAGLSYGTIAPGMVFQGLFPAGTPWPPVSQLGPSTPAYVSGTYVTQYPGHVFQVISPLALGSQYTVLAVITDPLANPDDPGAHAGDLVVLDGGIGTVPALVLATAQFVGFNLGGSDLALSSVGLGMPAWYSVANSPLTANGTIVVSAASGQPANQVLAVTSGALAVRALTAADFPASVVLTTGIYSQPGWLTSVLGSIVSGNISGNAASITGSITTSQVSNLSSWAGSTAITTLGTIVTGTIPGANVSGNIAGSAGGLTANIAESQVTNLTSDLAAKSPLASPTFTGVPAAPTPTTGTNTTQLATTAFVQTALPAVPVSSVFTRTGAVAATSGDYAVGQVTGAAPLASPTFTGAVTLPAGTVTLAEHANLAASSLMGNPTGSSAAPSAITLAGGLGFSGATLTTILPVTTDTPSAGTWTVGGTTIEHQATLAANTTIAFSGVSTGQWLTLYAIQAASGGPYTLSWPGGISWFTLGAVAPAITTAASSISIYRLKCTGSGTYDGFYAGSNDGSSGGGNGFGTTNSVAVASGGYAYLGVSMGNLTADLSISLPSAGTYQIYANLRTSLNINSCIAIGQYAYVSARLWDSTNSVVVTNTLTLLFLTSMITTFSTNCPFQSTGVILPTVYTVAGPTTIHVQSFYGGTVGFNTAGIAAAALISDSNGFTFLGYTRLY